MDVRGRKGSVEISTPNPSKTVGTVALRNFTIPRKKRVSGQVLLEPCPEDSRDYTLIQSKLRESRLDLRKKHANTWLWKDVKLVHHDDFLKEFSEKRSEMRTKGRHGREMEERFCFLVASCEATSQIYQFGLRTESQDQCSLGKPSHGVYLFKHVDVALKHAAASTCNGKYLIVFKVLFGKVKKVTASLEWNRTVDPMVSFDCHVAKDAVSYRDSLSQQVLGSSVFLFDYNENQELNTRPRQCLPYAVVSFVPSINATAPTSTSPPLSPTKPSAGLMHGPLEHLKGCTVAKRTGKGENATVTFKHFATTQGSPGVEYQSQTPRAEANGGNVTLFPYSDLQTPAPFIPHQHYMPYYNTAEYFNPSLPYYDSGIPWQHYLDKPAFFSNMHSLNSTSIYGGNTDTVEVIPQMSSEKISTIVYSSRLVKDPRLSRQETNMHKKSSEEERASRDPECEEQGHPANSPNQKEENDFTLSCGKQSLELDEHKEGRFPKPVLDDPGQSNHTVQPKTENMPSIKLFKMKFQKYGAYFKMTEEERHAKIWSKANLTTEQKQLLIDRIHFYEMHHQRYKQGLLFQKDTETETAFRSSQTEPQNNAVCPATRQHSPLMTKENQYEVNQSHMRHSVSSPVSNLTSTTGLVDTQSNEVDILSLDSDKLSQDICRPKENNVQEKEQDLSSASQIEPQDGGVVESLKEKIAISETVQGTIQPNPSEKVEILESTHDLEQSSCPSIEVEINNQDVHESEVPTSSKESFACKPTLSNTIEDCPEFEQHIIAMEVANCVDISVTDEPECNEQGQDGQNSTENQDKEALTHSKSDANSKMSIEVERGEAQQHNTIHNVLYKRLQLDQLLSNSNEANFLSNKSYLRPKGLDETPAINLPDSHVNETVSKEEDIQLTVKLKSNQKPPEKLTLSERFSKLRCLGQNLAAFVHINRLNHSYPSHLDRDLKHKPEAVISCSDGEKVTGNNNAELIKLMAQRYNENRLIEKCKRVRQEHSKVLRRKISSGPRNRTWQARVPFRKPRGVRKVRLLKAKRKYQKTKLRSCGQASFNKSTSESSSGFSCTETPSNADKDSDSHIDPAAAPQSQADSQSHGQLLNKESNQNDNASNVSTEKVSCVDSENKTGHGDESQQTKVQSINPAEQLAEIGYRDASELSTHKDLNKSQESINLDSEEPVITEEMVTNCGTNNNKTSHQEKSSLVTCSGSNESSNGESAEAEHKEEALFPKKLSQEDSCDTKEISPDYNTGAYEDTSSPVPTVSSIPSDITSGNVISSCTAKAQRAMTPDSPRVMSNEIDTQTKAGILGDSAVDDSASGLTKDVLSTNKSEEIDKNANPQDYINPKSTEANEKGLCSRKEMSDANLLNTQNGAKDNVTLMFTETTNHLSRPTSGPQDHPSLQDPKSSGLVNSVVEATSDFHSRIIKDAQEDVTVIKDNLHSVWQGQDKNNLPPTSDTQIISKLRDYLTKFEFTVKKQDPVSNVVTEHHAPMAWITLDSTAHKQQLHDTRHYSKQGLADITHRQSEVIHFQGAPTKHKQSNEDSQPNSSISKKRRMSNMERVSPDSTFTETVRNEPNSHLLNKDTQPYHTTSGAPNMNHWLQNHGNRLQENLIICPQVLGHLSPSSGQQGTGSREQPCQIKQPNEQTAYEKVHTTYIQNKYSVTDISNTLKLADHAVSLTELGPLQSKCKRMLQHFISNFEKDQNVSFHQSCITRNLILEKYLDHPPAPLELKFEAINSFLELQMIVEACQFVDNKMNFLRRKPTFRSLLWYDPSLYGELYKGTVGFQQQSSLFSAFQQCLTSEDYRRLREYYCAVSTLHQQLQDAPDTSYYMYLKTKRERLEIEAAFRNPSDVKSFFLSVPTAIMINLGDNLEILKKTHNIVSTFIETPADRLPGTFDVGKAEHLSIICRYLQEKIIFLKSHKEITKISWFGMEHLLYDASKVLVWSESEHGMPNEVLTKFNRLNSQIVYGVTEACVALVNKADQSSQPADIVQFTPPHQVNAVRIQSAGFSTDRTQTALNIHMEDGTKEKHQPHRRRATHPCIRSNFIDGVAPIIQPSLAAQHGSSPLYPEFTQRSNALNWRIHRNHSWDWSPADPIQSTPHSEVRALLLSKRIPAPQTKLRTTSLTDLPNSHAVRQQQPTQPLIVKPRPVERSNVQPTISAPQHAELLKKQANEYCMPMITPFHFPGFSPDAPPVMPPPLPPLSFSSTSNQVALHNNPTPISYPFFVFNGQTYSTTGSSVPVPSLHTETQYLPRPV